MCDYFRFHSLDIIECASLQKIQTPIALLFMNKNKVWVFIFLECKEQFGTKIICVLYKQPSQQCETNYVDSRLIQFFLQSYVRKQFVISSSLSWLCETSTVCPYPVLQHSRHHSCLTNEQISGRHSLGGSPHTLKQNNNMSRYAGKLFFSVSNPV